MTSTPVAEAILFWTLAPVAVLAAVGMLAVRKAVHSALLLALVMLCLAAFYVARGAVFLGVVQVVVYAGAIMMIFLFVLMMIGTEAADSPAGRARTQRVAAILVGLGFGTVLVAAIGRALSSGGVAAGRGVPPGDAAALARLIFTRYVWAFEASSALLLTAVLGAMVLAHRERTEPRLTQRERSELRFRSLPTGGRAGPLPSPGVYARRNAVDVPARLPDGTPAPNSVPGNGSATERTGAP